MLRRLLLSEKSLVDSNTLFFNDGTDFTDKSSDHIGIGYTGKVKIDNLGGKSCWYIGYENLSGMVYFKSNKLSIDKPSIAVQTIEFMIFCNYHNTYDRYVFNYGVDHDNYLLKILLVGTYSGNNILYEMRCKDPGGSEAQVNNGNIKDTKKWIHLAVETYLVNENVRRYCFYMDGKYIGCKDIARTTSSTVERMYQYYIGTDAEAGGNYFLYDAGIRNFRISNIRRYKEKDYIPYVDT